VLLAAWAADAHPELLPLIATGELRNGKIAQVADVTAKSRIVARSLMRGHPHTFLVPSKNEEEVIADLSRRFPDQIEKVEPQVEALFAREDRLTDGCHAYRELLGQMADEWATQGAEPTGEVDRFEFYQPEDRAWLDRLADQLLDATKAVTLATALPFGCEPRLAMRYLLRKLIRPGGKGVRIPLPFHVLDNGETQSPRERLVACIERGLADVGNKLIAAQTLRNLVGTFGDSLLLLAYSESSGKLAWPGNEGEKWKVLDDLGTLRKKQPGLLLLASDQHHLDRLCAENDTIQRLMPD
jgi:hypothetical protein